MNKFDQEEFNKFIVDHDVVGFFEKSIKLRSGREANWYVNWRDVSDDVFLLEKLTDFVISFVENLNLEPVCFCGVPEGATKLSLITQYKWAKMQPDYGLGVYPLSMMRGKLKEHGDPKDRYFVGYPPKGRTIILEDVTTTGGALVKTLDQLLELKAPVIACIGITNRNEKRDDNKTVAEFVAERNIKYYAMSNAIELLSLAFSKLRPSDKVAEDIEAYFEKYGIAKIKLK